MADSLGPPSPTEGWSREIVTIKNAIIVPGDQNGPGGVFHPDGTPVPESTSWRYEKPWTGIATFRRPVRKIVGSHFWMGATVPHFGHFLTEGTSRLWPWHESSAATIVTEAHHPSIPLFDRDYQRGILDLFGIRSAVTVVDAPVAFENLIVPGQGFGLGVIASGTDKYRAFVSSRFGIGIQPAAQAKLYLSRSKLPNGKGSILLERVLEENLSREGYEIFHPQDYPLPEQIARLRAATHVIGVEGSALHLLGMVAQADQRIAIIPRRVTCNRDDFYWHIGSFSGTDPAILDFVDGLWLPGRAMRFPHRLRYGEIDFAALGRTLFDLGFISSRQGWRVPTTGERDAAIADLSAAAGAPMVRSSRTELQAEMAALGQVWTAPSFRNRLEVAFANHQ